jgi:hypothetical protein
MEKINRNLSMHFHSKLFTGIKHEDILSEFEKEVNLEDETLHMYIYFGAHYAFLK